MVEHKQLENEQFLSIVKYSQFVLGVFINRRCYGNSFGWRTQVTIISKHGKVQNFI